MVADQGDENLAMLPEFKRLDCERMIFSFPKPPTVELLERCTALK